MNAQQVIAWAEEPPYKVRVDNRVRYLHVHGTRAVLTDSITPEPNALRRAWKGSTPITDENADRLEIKIGDMWNPLSHLLNALDMTNDFEPGDTEPCGDCGEPVYWDEDALSWRHVNPAPPECFLVHGAGATLDANERRSP